MTLYQDLIHYDLPPVAARSSSPSGRHEQRGQQEEGGARYGGVRAR